MAYISRDSAQRPILVIMVTLTLLGVFFTSLRLYAIRRRATKLANWDSLWIILSLIFALASEGPALVALRNGLGMHISDLNYTQITHVLEYQLISISLGLTAATFGKFAIIALLLDIQGPLVVYRKYLMHLVATLLGLSTISIIIVTWFQCTPVQKTWQPFLAGNCNGNTYSNALTFLNGGLNIAADIFLSLYPISLMWGLKLKMRAKLATCFLMGGGLLATVACVLRTVTVEIVWKNHDDLTYILGRFLIMALLELWLVIILGSLPALRPLFLSWFGSKDRNDNQGVVPLELFAADLPSHGTPYSGEAFAGHEGTATFRTMSYVEKKARLSSFVQMVVPDRNDSRFTSKSDR